MNRPKRRFLSPAVVAESDDDFKLLIEPIPASAVGQKAWMSAIRSTQVGDKNIGCQDTHASKRMSGQTEELGVFSLLGALSL